MTSLTVEEIEELTRLYECAAINMGVFPSKQPEDYPALCQLMFKKLPRLLAMLQPPVAADVAEARERLGVAKTAMHLGRVDGAVVTIPVVTVRCDDLRLLLSDHARLATENERIRNIVDAQDSTEDTPTLVEREIKAMGTENAAQAERIKRLEKSMEDTSLWLVHLREHTANEIVKAGCIVQCARISTALEEAPRG